MTKTKKIADVVWTLADADGQISEDTLSDICIEEAPDHARVENDGIGPYEFWGQKCFDPGKNYVEFDGFTIAFDATGVTFTEDDYTTETVTGTATIRGDENAAHLGDEPEFMWRCEFDGIKTIDGRTYIMYWCKQDK